MIQLLTWVLWCAVSVSYCFFLVRWWGGDVQQPVGAAFCQLFFEEGNLVDLLALSSLLFCCTVLDISTVVFFFEGTVGFPRNFQV